MKYLLLLFMLSLTSVAAYACPFCNSATAKKVRAEIFGPDFMFNLLVTVTPFLLFTLIIILIYKGIRLHPPENNT